MEFEKEEMPELETGEKQNSPNEMGIKNEGKLLLSFAIPAIIGMLCSAMQNIVNRIFVGNAVGSLGIAGVMVCFPLMVVFMAVSMLIGIGATTLAAIRLGQKNREEAEQLLGQAISLLTVLPLLLCLIAWPFQEKILTLFGATSTIMPYAKDYMSVILIAIVFFCLSMGVNNFIRTEGKPQIAMGTQILAAVVNIIINYFFVIRFNWGVKGAASGILIGNIVSLFWIFGYFLGKKSYLKIRLKNLRLNFSLILKIFMLGIAPFLMQLANSVQQLVMNRTLSEYGGDNALAAVGIVSSLATLLVMPLIGFNQGAQPIIGYNYGAKKLERVKRTLKKGILYSTIFGVVSFVVVQTCSVPLASLFTADEPDVIELAAHALRVFFLFLPLIGYQMMCSGYFQATGHPIYSAVLSLSRQVLVYIPLLCILPNFWGLEGAWRTAPISDGVSVIVTTIVTFFAMKRLNREIQWQQEKKARKAAALEAE